uniref:Uncharacterized protein n=1 Tax=Oryza glaberrima TaxID=4538 RepID=I1PX21_ORYGL
THTHPYERTHAKSYPYEYLRRLGRQILEIDEVTIGGSLSTGFKSGMHREHEPKSVTVQKRVFRTVDLQARSSTATRCRRVLCVLR